MGRKEREGNPNPTTNEEREGNNLLGSPTFVSLQNGRFKCVETGHELPAHSRDSYAQSKHCRLGLIDSAVAHNKPPLNMFRQDPLSRSKLLCKLTGDTINKSEEHIWKHINGRRFLNMLEKKEAEKEMQNGTKGKQDEEKEEKNKETKKNEGGGFKKKKVLKMMNMKVKNIEVTEENEEEIFAAFRDVVEKDNVSEEVDFWIPPKGERWDHDDGGDRWVSDFEDAKAEGANHDAGELAKRAKRISLEIGPSGFATRKKKKKINVNSVAAEL